MTGWIGKISLLLGSLGILLVLSACGSTSLNRAPVEERMTQTKARAPVAPAKPVAAPPVQPPAALENAGKAIYYTVKPGDTLIRISLEQGQAMQDLARWNHLENPNRIEVGQVLLVQPGAASEAVLTKPVASASVLAKPLSAAASATSAAPTALNPAPATAKAASSENKLNWIWPANGAVLSGFDEVKNKGLDIGGVVGEPVLAAADGRVVYVGAGLRGYGNLIILKHDNVFLTAYAHNQTLLVKEDQTVQKGQKIAEMGSSDADRVKLHFEVRRQGKPVDPAKFLPARQ